jgi:hypothetical protein
MSQASSRPDVSQRTDKAVAEMTSSIFVEAMKASDRQASETGY